MNLLFLSSNIGVFGAEGVILNLIKALPKSVHCTLGNFFNAQNPHTELADAVSDLEFEVKQIPCSGAFDLSALRKISQVIKEEKIDLIHSHGYKSDFYGLIAAKTNHIPIISTFHSFQTESVKGGFYARLQKFLYRFFNQVVCVSDKLLEELKKTPLSQQKMRIIDNGITTDDYLRDPQAKKELAAKWNLPTEGVFIGVAGRLSPEKGFDIFCQAAARIAKKQPNVYFLIAGQGPEEEHLQEIVQNLKLEERIIFLGLVKNMNEFFSSLDIFVLSSLTEGLPLVILEAMAAGLPIVATTVGAVGQVVMDKKTGIQIGRASCRERV